MRRSASILVLAAGLILCVVGWMVLADRAPARQETEARAAAPAEADPTDAGDSLVSVDASERASSRARTIPAAEAGHPIPARQGELIVQLVAGGRSAAGWAVSDPAGDAISFPGGRVTDGKGRIVLHARATRTRLLEFTGPGQSWSSRHAVTFPFEGQRRSLTIEVPAGGQRGEITFQVVDEATGERLQGVSIERDSDAGQPMARLSDADGRATLPYTPGSSYLFVADGYSERTRKFVSPGGVETVGLQRPAFVKGTIALGGAQARLSHIRLHLISRSERKRGAALHRSELKRLTHNIRVGRDGRWGPEPLSVPFGASAFEVASTSVHAEGLVRSFRVNKPLVAGETLEIVDPWISAQDRVLRVECPSGGSLEGVELTLTRADGEVRLTARATPEGRFELGPVPDSTWTGALGLATFGPFELTGAETVLTLTEHLVLETSVAGLLGKADQTPYVTATTSDGRTETFRTDGRGIVRLLGLPVASDTQLVLYAYRGPRTSRALPAVAIARATVKATVDGAHAAVHWEPVPEQPFPPASRQPLLPSPDGG